MKRLFKKRKKKPEPRPARKHDARQGLETRPTSWLDDIEQR